MYSNEVAVDIERSCHERCINRTLFSALYSVRVNIATILGCFPAVIQLRYEWAASISINSWSLAKHSETNQLHTVYTPPHYSTANTPIIMVCYDCYDMDVG